MRTLGQIKWALLTVCSVLAIAYVMNFSGQTVTLGTWAAGAGGLFAFLSPLIGWFGTAVTSSDTSTNSLFGALQVAADKHASLSPTLLAGANSSGGVLAVCVSLQSTSLLSWMCPEENALRGRVSCAARGRRRGAAGAPRLMAGSCVPAPLVARWGALLQPAFHAQPHLRGRALS
ncbi:MAG TPA: L-lactate permease [Solirubrobacteraceae bacterium]|nr:L-lactate permease [Solirubrobacteraceae bacterium]